MSVKDKTIMICNDSESHFINAYSSAGGNLRAEMLASNIHTAMAPVVAQMIERGQEPTKAVNRMELRTALLKCLQEGLVPGREAVFVPFYSKKEARLKVSVIATYRGYLNKLQRLGIKVFQPLLICENDEFTPPAHEFSDGKYQTTWHHKQADGERGKIIGVIVAFKDTRGNYDSLYLNRDELLKAREAAKKGGKESNFWRDYPAEMIKKTAIRRLVKYIPDAAFAFDESETIADSVDAADDDADDDGPRGHVIEAEVNLEDPDDAADDDEDDEPEPEPKAKKKKESKKGKKKQQVEPPEDDDDDEDDDEREPPF